MKPYSEYRPTQFDPRGLAADRLERGSWLVLEVSRNRDSGPRAQSNFTVALAELGGESDTVEIHRFGHWANGWFELILIDPSATAQIAVAESIECALADYPVLSDTDCSEREYADYVESWNQCGLTRDFAKALRAEFALCDAAADFLSDLDNEVMRAFYEELTPSGDYYETCDNGANFGRRVEYAAKRCTREQLAAFLRQNRNAAVAA